ncbi:Tify-like protein [Thalictrum thalictroides]|uniref:Protein TIFY n=1 Tax=Thalictrum thalictroides TaxID=46969 RepID=A0A7J6WER8_THATH|nr:Tify-like protein [Thalictrum thalictroides]
MAQPPHNNNKNSNNKDGDGGNPIFHDFFGRTCASDSSLFLNPTHKFNLNAEVKFPEASVSASAGASSSGGIHGPVSTISDLASGEGLMGSQYQGIPILGQKSELSGPEPSNRFHGRKRSNSDSVFMGMPTDRFSQIGPDSLESSPLMKMLRDNAGGERLRRYHNDELPFGMQPPKSHLILQPSAANRHDSVTSKWEHSLMNAGPSIQYPSRLGQGATYTDKVSSRDRDSGPTLISPPAADEGSRTGMKGSGIWSAVNATSGVERNAPEMLTSNHRPKTGPPNADPDTPRQSGLNPASRQMTIFYAGQAHVFDDVHTNKADVIMALAGSNGGSWSTTYSPNSTESLSLNETKVLRQENGPGFSNVAHPQEVQGNLFLPGTSSHGFNHVGRISSTFGDSRNTMSGSHQGSMKLRHTRSFNQPAEPNTKGNQEV